MPGTRRTDSTAGDDRAAQRGLVVYARVVWTIRPAKADEGPALSALALRAKASWEYPPETVAAFAAELTLDSAEVGRAFVVEADGQPVGFHGLEVGPEGDLELAFLFVEPALHRRGIGASLLRHAMAQARAHGHERMLIQGDPNAAAFYTWMGATRIGSRESASISGRALPLFEIRL